MRGTRRGFRLLDEAALPQESSLPFGSLLTVIGNPVDLTEAVKDGPFLAHSDAFRDGHGQAARSATNVSCRR